MQIEDSKTLQDDLLDQLIDQDMKEIQMARANQKEKDQQDDYIKSRKALRKITKEQKARRAKM